LLDDAHYDKICMIRLARCPAQHCQESVLCLQAAYQLAGVAANVGIALAGGALAGLLAKYINPARQTMDSDDLFEDSLIWEEVEPEKGLSGGHETPAPTA